MTTQLLIYERAVAVTRERHGDWSVKTGTDYGFARNVNSVPLVAAEFPNAAEEYAIVFAGTPGNIVPMAVLGVQNDQNLFVAEDGTWQGRYIPAFLRRYPFVFASGDDGATFTLCIDEEFSGCNTEGRGERLFDSQGEQTQYLQGVLGFLQAFQAQFLRTQAFCKKLEDLELLEPMQAQFQIAGGRVSLGGFTAINRDRLKALAGERLAELAATDELELAYLHLQSLRNLTRMVERMGQRIEAAAGPAAPAAEDTAPPAPAPETATGNGAARGDGGAAPKGRAKAKKERAKS